VAEIYWNITECGFGSVE